MNTKYLVAVTTAVVTVTTNANEVTAQPPRVHVTAAGAHPVGGTQEREFGAGGGGTAALEIPVGGHVGFQATAGGVALSKGDPPADPRLAPKSAGSVFLGTVGVRVRMFGASRVAGPWVDANGGLAQTGDRGRVALDMHVGWDFRVDPSTRWDVGPFIGYTQILQPEGSIGTDDARIAWAGVQISLGAKAPVAPPPAPVMGKAPPLPLPDRDATAEVEDVCPPPSEIDGTAPEGCPTKEVELVGDVIVINDVIHFEYDSPRIRRESYGLVRRIAQFVVDHPEILEVTIEGHADARGTEEYNLRLSEARAASTRELLVRFGVDGARLRTVGHGKSRLKVPTQLADRRNRRVEFVVTQGGATAGPPPPPSPATASPPPSTPPRVSASKTRGRP